MAGAARATAIPRSPKHLGAAERGFRNVATSVACSGALNPATGAGSRPQIVALSVCRSPTEKERPAQNGPVERASPRFAEPHGYLLPKTTAFSGRLLRRF